MDDEKLNEELEEMETASIMLTDEDGKDTMFEFLDLIIERFGLQEGDKRLVFNVNNEGQIVFTIGQRYVWITGTNEEGFKFEVISEKPISNKYLDFDGKPTAFWNGFSNISEVLKHQQSIFNAIEKELNRTQISGFLRHNKEELEKMAFDADFRKEVLDQLKTITITDEPMKNTDKTPVIPLNQILFGAPGTGKTYHTKKMAVEIINGKKERTREEINKEYEELIEAGQIVFTTFHQSLSYEDFIEGIKPETIDGNVTYEIKDGIFKQLCSRAIQNNLNIGDLVGGYEITKNTPEIVYLKKPKAETIVPIPKYLIDQLSKLVHEGKINYEDIKNKIAIDKMPETTEKYILNGYPNIFAQLVEKINTSNKKNKQNYVLIIDEINRGNVSAIFGELITLLEEDKRKGNPEHTEVVLPYSGDNFSVPNNVYIIGTMNTADRSVEALDTALRRRFSFVEMQPNPNILSKVGNVDLSKLLETINKRIEVLIDKDHQIGHSYFIGIQNIDDLRRTFKDKIIPLLEEYFYGDFGKIGLVLGGKFIESVENKTTFPKNFTYEEGFSEDKKIYHFTPSKDWDDETFKSIYKG